MKNLAIQGGIAIVLFAGIVFGIPMVEKYWNGTGNMEDYFVVRQFEIEKKTEFGKYPRMFYDSDVKKDFSSNWNATIQNIDGAEYRDFCSGGGHYDFKSNLGNSQKATDISWIVGKNKSCERILVSPGYYRIIVRLTNIDRGNKYLPTEMEIVSNVFEVLPRGVLNDK